MNASMCCVFAVIATTCFCSSLALSPLQQHDAGDLLGVDEIADVAEEFGLAELAVVDDVLVVLGRLDLQLAVDDRRGQRNRRIASHSGN